MAMDRASCLASLDSEIAILEQGVVSARRRRNRKLAVQALPAEVLTMIIAEAQDGWAPRQRSRVLGGTRMDRYDLGWMCLQHVCSMWSEVRL